MNAADFLAQLDALLPQGGLLAALHRIPAAIQSGQSISDFAHGMGLNKGFTGYIQHTVTIVLYAWLRHPRDYRTAVLETIRCGGDTDTTAAIVAGIVGAANGVEGIPADWRSRLILWPFRPTELSQLAALLSETMRTRTPRRPPETPFLAQLTRNALLMPVVLGIGIRRCFPPYSSCTDELPVT